MSGSPSASVATGSVPYVTGEFVGRFSSIVAVKAARFRVGVAPRTNKIQ